MAWTLLGALNNVSHLLWESRPIDQIEFWSRRRITIVIYFSFAVFGSAKFMRSPRNVGPLQARIGSYFCGPFNSLAAILDLAAKYLFLRRIFPHLRLYFIYCARIRALRSMSLEVLSSIKLFSRRDDDRLTEVFYHDSSFLVNLMLGLRSPLTSRPNVEGTFVQVLESK